MMYEVYIWISYTHLYPRPSTPSTFSSKSLVGTHHASFSPLSQAPTQKASLFNPDHCQRIHCGQAQVKRKILEMLGCCAQSGPTLCDPMDCSLPGFSVHGDSPGKITRVGCHALLQGIFPTQGSNPGLLHCRWILSPSGPSGKPCIGS